MSNISSVLEKGILTIFVSGRIDSTNAPAAEAEIDAIRNASDYSSVIIDADNLEYISSAGLRIILRIRKNDPSLKIINTSSEVYEIFDMTGFTEMIPVSKAYRKLSVDGCEVIGQGANGVVYRLDPDTIIKVYRDADALPDIHRERELARRAFVLGIPTAIPYDVVKVGDSYGSVFELLNANSFAKLIAEEPDNLDKYAALSVELLQKIHGTAVEETDMPDMREVVIGWAEFLNDYLPQDKAEKLVTLVKSVPKIKRMMHGDYHIKNVMMQNGEVLLIDMDTLCFGHPVFEFASIFNAYIGFQAFAPAGNHSFLGIPADISAAFWKKTLELYFDTKDEVKLTEIENKAALIGYTRLMRRLIRRHGLETTVGRTEIAFYKDRISELLDKVDSLVF